VVNPSLGYRSIWLGQRGYWKKWIQGGENTSERLRGKDECERGCKGD